MSQVSHDLITAFFEDLLGFEPDLNIDHSEDGVHVHIEIDPQHSGVIIGYRGEVLTSIQLVLSLMLQESRDQWIPVRVNVNDYREQRQESLENLALNAAEKALESGTPIQLTNLSSYERRIIHSALSSHDQIETFSEGEGSNRVLVISPAE